MKLDKNYFVAREAAMTWLNRNPKHRNYDEGVSILVQSGYKKNVADKLQKHGEQPWTVEKLHYCLREMIQMYYNPDDPKFSDGDDIDIINAESKKTISPDDAETVVKESNDKKKVDTMPQIVQVLIRSFSDAYKKRDIIHRKMSQLPETNDEKTVELRAQYSREIDSLSELMDRLYQFKNAYDKDGKLPDKNDVDKILIAAKPIDIKVESSEDKITSMNKIQLQTRHHSLVNQIRRKNNLLLYQSKSKLEKENPMPECPKKVKTESQITKLKDELQKIDYALAKI